MARMHRLLKRQLKQFFGEQVPMAEEWQEFINTVNNAYQNFDRERKLLESSLELRSQELYRAKSDMRAIFPAISDLIFWLDSEGTILDYNAGAITDLFLQPQELFGKRIQDVPSGQTGHQFYEAIQRVQKERSVVTIDYSLTLQGQLFFYEARLVPLLEDQIAVIIRNITKRKRAEAALRQEEERSRYVTQATRDAIYDWDIPANTVWRNEAYQTLYSPNEPVGTDESWWEHHIHPDDRRPMIEGISQAFRKGSHFWTGEYRFLRFDGNYATVVDRGYILYDHVGLPVRMIGAITDITERKRAEAEREALISKLEAKNAELERFTYTVSHDLKSPLITIQGFLGFVEQAALSGNVAQIKADMARITNAVSKMKQLLDELLELSRIGRLMNPPETIPLGDLAREAVDMVAGRLTERGVNVIIAPNLPQVYGDRSRLREVLENLVDNAVKYMGNQPQPMVEIGVRNNGAEPIFYVRDNGIGIDLRYHQKIFALFDKLDQRSEGVGVGLTIAKRVVEVHGGRIWVESEGVGQGSSFCFTLPDKKQSVDKEIQNFEKRTLDHLTH